MDYKERYGLMAVVPTLTALLLSSLNDLQFFFVFLYARFYTSFRAQSIICKCTSCHLFSYGGLRTIVREEKLLALRVRGRAPRPFRSLPR